MAVDTKERTQWIDVARFLAIVAVMTDHTYCVLYSTKDIAQGTYFSVSLFILLTGITMFWSLRNPELNFKSWVIRRIKGILGPYLIASAVCVFLFYRFFDLEIYINGVVHFNIVGAFYYVLLYLQLIVIAPLLYQIFVFSNNKKLGFLIEVVGLLFVVIISFLTMNYTNILSVYGGGGKLFGGTYLILLYLGMCIGKYYEKIRLKRWQSIIVFVIGLSVSVLCWKFIVNDQFQLDKRLPFGNGINPPGISLIIYTLLITATIYSLGMLIRDFENSVFGIVFKQIAKLGKHTLYIFLYHGFWIEVLALFFETPIGRSMDHIWVKRVVYFPCMILGSLFIEFMMKKGCGWIKKVYNT